MTAILKPALFGVLLGCAESAGSWTRANRSEASTLLKLTIAIKQPQEKLDTLREIYWRISNPDEPTYAQHLSAVDVVDLTRPRDDSLEAVIAWLAPTGCNVSFSTSGDFAFCPTTVAEAERLMPGATYHEYETVDALGTRSVVHRTSDYSLPNSVAAHVDFVAPTSRLPLKKLAFKHGSQELRSGLGTNPDSLRSLYGLGDVEAVGAAGNSQQVAGFIGNYFSPRDLQIFFSQYYPKGKDRTATVVGPNEEGQPTTEGSLDMEYIMSVGANVPTTYWYTAGARPYEYGDNEPFVDWLSAVNELSDAEMPKVISVSYADEEFVIDPEYADRVDVEFQKISVRGVSMLFGSGDDGVTGDKGECPGDRFVSWWPASSPYVTAVGGVEEYNTAQGASFSGGGFSNRYATPDYQKEHVETYLSGDTPPESFWNRTGAGFPDVSACGMGFWTIVGGIPDEVGGTSAATPTFAGIVSLLNDSRMAAGMNAMGPLNQVFYKHPEVFTDITRGTNTGGGGCGVGGFSAAAGWDPVTGLGTPKYPELLKLAMSLPSGKPMVV